MRTKKPATKRAGSIRANARHEGRVVGLLAGCTQRPRSYPLAAAASIFFLAAWLVVGNAPVWAAFPTGWTIRCTHSVTTEPASNLTDFTYLVSLNQMPSEFWEAVQTDGDDIRASADSAGSTRLPVDIIEFTDSGSSGSGLIAVKYSGTKSSGSDEPLYIWVGDATATLPADSDTYGADNAYASHIRAFYPSGGGNDRTSYVNNLTMAGSPTVGGTAGPINGSKATDYDGSSQFGRATASVPTGVPLTLLAHGASDSDSLSQIAVCLTDTGTDAEWFGLGWRGTTAGDPIAAFTAQLSTTTGVAESTTGYSVGAFALGSAQIIATNSRKAKINAGSNATNTNTNTPTSIDSIAVGALRRLTTGNHFDGDVSLVVVSTETGGLADDWISYWKEMLDDADQSDFYGTWSASSVGGTGSPWTYFLAP